MAREGYTKLLKQKVGKDKGEKGGKGEKEKGWRGAATKLEALTSKKREKMEMLQEIRTELAKKLFERKKEPEFLEEQIRTKPPVEDGEEE